MKSDKNANHFPSKKERKEIPKKLVWKKKFCCVYLGKGEIERRKMEVERLKNGKMDLH